MCALHDINIVAISLYNSNDSHLDVLNDPLVNHIAEENRIEVYQLLVNWVLYECNVNLLIRSSKQDKLGKTFDHYKKLNKSLRNNEQIEIK